MLKEMVYKYFEAAMCGFFGRAALFVEHFLILPERSY